MKKDTFENRLNLARIKAKIPEEKLLMGSIKEKFPVLLKDGRTIIYISDKSKVEETREKYESLLKSNAPAHSIKYRPV